LEVFLKIKRGNDRRQRRTEYACSKRAIALDLVRLYQCFLWNPAAGSDKQKEKEREEGKGEFDPARLTLSLILSSFLE